MSAAATAAPNPSSSSSGGGGSGGGGISSGGGGGGGSGSGSSGGGPTGPCGSCKFLRRKCVTGCIFAPYFDAEQGATHFAAVHKVFGASNVSKLLLQIPVHKRLDAVVTICYEAQARLRDPVYGCVAHIFALQQQVVSLQTELAYLQAHLAQMELPTPPPQPNPLAIPPPLSISDLPSASSMPASYDLTSLFDPMGPPSSWAMQQQQQQRHALDPHHYGRVVGGGISSSSIATSGGMGGGDLQALAQEFMQRHGSSRQLPLGCAEPLSSPPVSK